jgi:type II secretory pathway pseudopilin PulG
MRRDQRGDSLIEIIIAMIVIGLVVSAIVAAISTSENGSASHRDLVTADNVLRNYAESVKAAVRNSCPAGSTWSTSYTPPAGYAVSLSGSSTCPAVTTAGNVALQVTLPNGTVKTLSIAVRTP